MTIAVRFAPSPTGLLHVGNIRAALYNWLFARRHGGSFMLRFDDTDHARSRPEYATAIERDMRWLGLTWDRTARQSDRHARYDEVADKLRAAGRLYPCFESAEELGLKRKAQLAQGLPPLYDRAALRLTPGEIEAKIAEGHKPHWRFKLEHKPTEWDDLIQGPKSFDGAALSDPVVIREDGVPLYTYCSIVDDVDFSITHVVRGEDHVANTAVQIQIWEAVAAAVGSHAKPCKFGHFPLLVSATGEEMSKRLGTLSIQQMRDDLKLEPSAITSLLARLGTSLPIEAHADVAELAPAFDLGAISRNPPKLDLEELKRINARVLQVTPYARVEERLKALGVGGGETFWNAVRAVITTLDEAKEWWTVLTDTITPPSVDPAMMEVALKTLPPGPWDSTTFSRWTSAVKEASGKSGKALFMPLRLALTGRDHGPELKDLLPLIGEDRVRARLSGKAA